LRDAAAPPADGAIDLGALAARFPRTAAAFADLPVAPAEREATLRHVVALERAFAGRRQSLRRDDRGAPATDRDVEFDVALAGGGLSLLYGVYLARAGYRVVICDRRRIGCGHREWNVSRPELRPLSASGLFDEAEVDRLVLLAYRRGIVRWHGGDTYPVRGVLDCVVDAQGLLDALRQRALAAGATLLDHHQAVAYGVGPAGVALDLVGPGGPRRVTARLLIDATGASSPHAEFDLVCPTVGGVLAGLAQGQGMDELDPETGEILISTEGVEDGRQHIWEGFPTLGARLTTYLFYYTEPGTLGEHPLLALYERFFECLPRYKRGPAVLERATYGFIPAYTRLGPRPVAPAPRVVLVGDAAGRHSPLTFCGFGSMMRSFHPVAQALAERLAADRLSQRALTEVWGEPPGLKVMGGLALTMSPRPGSGAGQEINHLLDVAFASLAELGEDVYGRFIRDEVGFADFCRFLGAIARRHPGVYRQVLRHLTPRELLSWSWQFLSFGVSSEA
jgi:lycopene cyclase CruA